MDALLTAFLADAFDATKLPPEKSPHAGMEHDVSVTAQLLPALRSDQRATLAAERERMAALRAKLGSSDALFGDDRAMEEGLRGPGGRPGGP
jgi:hypothetical protein